MRSLSPLLTCAAGLAFLFLVGAPSVAQAQSCSSPFFVEQRFPVSGTEETRWRLCWEMRNRNGLIIRDAWFRKAPNAPWVKVIYDARVAEIFVPYHTGSPRFLDMSGFNFGSATLTDKHCPRGVGGTLLSRDVCKEVRDRGLAWNDDSEVRRGQELVLWGVIDAANYNYVIEWTFRDDGVILGRVGATATNLPGIPLEAHMHGPIWRLDIDLNGAGGDSAHLSTHTESFLGLTATDTDPIIAREGGRVWSAPRYNAIHIHDSNLRNANNHHSGYMLIPLRNGTPRHQENFTKNDFWVSRYRSTELAGASVPSYVAPAEPTVNTDNVIWYYGGAHHIPRDEDGEHVNGRFEPLVAHVMWTGFML
ncbi:MAG TPA: hypothetical protein VF240_02185, partial [Pyrinomonadaceae bacterium]